MYNNPEIKSGTELSVYISYDYMGTELQSFRIVSRGERADKGDDRLSVLHSSWHGNFVFFPRNHIIMIAISFNMQNYDSTLSTRFHDIRIGVQIPLI